MSNETDLLHSILGKRENIFGQRKSLEFEDIGIADIKRKRFIGFALSREKQNVLDCKRYEIFLNPAGRKCTVSNGFKKRVKARMQYFEKKCFVVFKR
jgi:hypothetical protein